MPIITPGSGGGGSGGASSLLWAAFDSDPGALIADGASGLLTFRTSFIGAGTLPGVTWSAPQTGLAIADAGCYLVSVTTNVPGFALADVVDPADLELELQVFNNEPDPFFVYDVLRPVDPFAEGAGSCVINVLASDDPSTGRGFSVPIRARGCTLTPSDTMVFLKVVQIGSA